MPSTTRKPSPYQPATTHNHCRIPPFTSRLSPPLSLRRSIPPTSTSQSRAPAKTPTTTSASGTSPSGTVPQPTPPSQSVHSPATVPMSPKTPAHAPATATCGYATSPQTVNWTSHCKLRSVSSAKALGSDSPSPHPSMARPSTRQDPVESFPTDSSTVPTSRSQTPLTTRTSTWLRGRYPSKKLSSNPTPVSTSLSPPDLCSPICLLVAVLPTPQSHATCPPSGTQRRPSLSDAPLVRVARRRS